MSILKENLDVGEATPIENTVEEATVDETKQHPAVAKVLLGKALNKAITDALLKAYKNQTTPVTENAIAEISSHLAAIALGEQFNPNRWIAIADSAKVTANFLDDIIRQSQQQQGK